MEQKKAVIETKFGNIELEFFPDVAPGHVKNFTKLIKIIKKEKLSMDLVAVETKIKSIRKNLKQLEIEKLSALADTKLDGAKTLKDKELTNALEMATEAISLLNEALEMAKRDPEFSSLVESIKAKMIEVRNFQEGL